VRRPFIALACGAALIALGGLGSPAGAQSSEPAAAPPSEVLIVKVTGVLDPNLAEFVESQIADAERANALVVLQVKSTKSVLSDAQLQRLASALRDASVPITSWIGPSGSKVGGRVAQLVSLTDIVGISPGSRLGDLGEIVIDGGDFGGKAPKLLAEMVGASEAVTLGVAIDAPVIGSFIVDLPGVQTTVVETDEGPRREPATPVLFSELTIVRKMMHTVASPPVAYLFFLIGLGLLVFELFSAGVGLAGGLGALCLVLGGYGLAVLPTRPWAVAVLVLAAFGYAVDVQTGVPRFWTGVGVAASLIGSLYLYDGIAVPWLTMIVGVAGLALGMISGMPALVRTRFSTPTIGRDWMIGEFGVAESAVDPDGVVRVRDALWRARTNRATPIPAGDKVRVIEIAGLILEVEPESGAARDHRERRSATAAE
jgi:membrane-bound serine protease (ClpP class)